MPGDPAAADPFVEQAMADVYLSDDFTVGKLASDAIYAYLREDTDRVIGTPVVFGREVRERITKKAPTLIPSIQHATGLPPQQVGLFALLIVGVEICVDKINAANPSQA